MVVKEGIKISKEEKYFFLFKYIDGSEQEFKRNDDKLSAKIRNSEKRIILVDNIIINLDNVIKVTMETLTQREEKKKDKDETNLETMEALSKMNF